MIFYLIYKLGVFIATILPLKFAYKFAVFVSDLHYLFARQDHINVAANLKVIFPEKNLSEIKAIRLAMSRNFAKYLVDFFRVPMLNQNNIKDTVELVNFNYVKEALVNGKGAITATAHLANWELAGIAVALSGYPIAAVVLPHRHKSVDDFFNSQREKRGLIPIPLGKSAAFQCLNFLNQNKIIALVGDRVFDGKGQLVDFFGLPAYLPKGAAILSFKSKAPVIPGFMLRNPDNTYKLIFEKPIQIEPSGNRENDLMQVISKYKLILEDYIRRYPEQWFMFRKFWTEGR